ncbi:glycosyltransferase [candidate division KSB1 bacterium]|nr:glycosyltransferase [candidate division KSB1 bacterium]
MKILYISFAVQHPKLPGSTRQYHLMKELVNNHEVTLLALGQKEVSSDILSDLATLAKSVLIIPARPLYKEEKRISKWSKAVQHRKACMKMRRAVDDLLRADEFDAIVFHGKTVYPAIEHLKDVPIVADFCDASSLRISSELKRTSPKRLPFLLYRYLKMRRIEKRLLRQTPYQAFISSRDRQAIAGENALYDVIPNGIDLEFWRSSGKNQEPHDLSLIFTGVMSFKPNHEAALYLLQHIAPAINKTFKSARILVVGKDPQKQIVELGQEHPNITVTGYVPDIRSFLASASVFVAPIQAASGMQNKILEAMAMQIPVVTSPNVADGIAIDGHDLPVLVAKTKDEYIKHIETLLSDNRLRERMGIAGLRYVRAHFNWTKSANLLEQLLINAKNDPRWKNRELHQEKIWSRKLHSPMLSEK